VQINLCRVCTTKKKHTSVERKNMTEICDHGHLARACEICELEQINKRLRACIRKLIKQEDPEKCRVRFDWARDILSKEARR
jgi:hypothetical protein